MTTYEDVSKRAGKFLSLTGYTVEEFQALLPYCTTAFLANVAKYTREGKRRQQRSYTTYTNSPLPTVADKLLFILIYLKTNNLQEVQAHLFGMHQPEANKWLHLLLPVANYLCARCQR